jgi:hypothetical protein
MIVVLDANVEVSADDRLLAEYRLVLQRPKFGFATHAVEETLHYLVQTGQAILASPLAVALPNVDDLPFLEVAAGAQMKGK